MKRLVSALDAAPWTLVGGLRVPWAAYDQALGGGRGEHHVYLDALVAQLKANGVFHPFQFYARGFGDTVHLPRFARELPRLGSAPAAALEMTFAESAHGNGAAAVVDAAFNTPAERALLPMQSSTAHVQFVVPTSWLREHPRQPPAAAAGASAETRALELEMLRLRPVVVLLPGTGEQGFRRRRHCVAYPLAERGIATAILEGPFYGRRRPSDQAASKLAHYMDLMVLGRSTLDEARALVAWLLPGGDCGGGASGGSISGVGSAGSAVAASSTADAASNLAAGAAAAKDALDCLRSRALGCGGVVLAGTSMGGLHAAMTACHLPPHLGERTGVVSWLGPPSAAPVFTLGALRTGVAWGALARHADLATPAGSALEAHLAAMEAALPPDPPGVDHAADVAASEAHQRGGEALASLAFATHRPRGGASGSAGSAPPPAVAATAPSAATATAAPRLRPPTGSATMAAVAQARRQLARMSRVTHLTLHPPPLRADAAIFTRAAFDQYIPDTRSVQAMWRHIAGGVCGSGGSGGGGGGGGGGLRDAAAAAATWRGCELRTIRGGHVSASIFQLDEYCRCIVEAVRRLQRR